MKKRIFTVMVSVILSLSLLFTGVVPVSALNIADIFAGLMGGGSGDKINIWDSFGDWLQEKIDEEGPMDKIVENIKNEWNGVTEDAEDDPEADTEEVIVIDEAEASNIAELFNLTVNELKVSNPGFIKTQTASMSAELSKQLQGGLGPVTGIVEALIGTKDIFAGVIDGTNKEGQIRTVYKAGNNIINNMPVSGKDYVACLEAADIKDYTITIYRSGAYKMHIDLNDVEGSAAQSGLAHVFDTQDKAFATIELGTTSINIAVMLKYVDCYVECAVNRDGEITSYTQNMGVTFLFLQEDGVTYGPEMPFLGVDFEKEGVVYNINTEYSGIDFSQRLMGDANLDGKVNSSDARTVLRVASGLDEMAADDIPYCDVNSDGEIRAADARSILRAASGIEKLPTTQDALGLIPYVKDEATQAHIDDLLAIMMAYQSAKDEEAKKELQDYYEDKYENGGSGTTEPETTTRPISSPDNIIDDVIGGIGDIIGGGGLGDIFGDTGLGGIFG